MAGSWTSERFPQFEKAIRRLTDQHRELEDEPLHLAISYSPPRRDQQDVYLFEVVGGPWQSISPENDLFEVSFAGTPEFPLEGNQQLHLVLTNPAELDRALQCDWPLVIEVVNAIRAGDFQVLHSDDEGKAVLEQLKSATQQQEAVRG